MREKDAIIWERAAHVVLMIFSLMCLLPFVLLVIASFTGNDWAAANGFTFFPGEWSLEAYQYVAHKWDTIGRAYCMTVIITVIGTAGSLMVSALFAYTLSKKNLPGVSILNFICIFTMLFSGGIVSSYYCWVNIFHVKNTIAAMIFPNLFMSAFNVVLVKNYFITNIPPALKEAARIDGAGEYRIFFKIVLPLSLPILATVGLMTALSYWNDWTNGLYYLTQRGGSHLYTIQVVLNNINENIQLLTNNSTGLTGQVMALPTTTVRMAIAVMGILPIVVIYPFFQKYFVKGITLGGVKE